MADQVQVRRSCTCSGLGPGGCNQTVRPLATKEPGSIKPILFSSIRSAQATVVRQRRNTVQSFTKHEETLNQLRNSFGSIAIDLKFGMHRYFSPGRAMV